MRLLGIDPGKRGAFAIFNPGVSIESGLRWVLWDVPLDEDEKLDAARLRDVLRKYSPDIAVLERVQAMPSTDGGERSMGAVSAFNFGDVSGAIRAVVQCCDIPLKLIVPVQWKRFHNIPKKSDKEVSRKLALKLFPEMGESLRFKYHQNRAEAMLIAKYGVERFGSLI